MLSIADITYVEPWNQALARHAEKPGLNAASVAANWQERGAGERPSRQTVRRAQPEST